ncbi:hypothetical protein EJ419_06310 [Alloscardovia theropitheci]|uniref:Uncharacterized protein n=1 Tax=Alloscardovia theropitheci TaxID=2496842 RepID=A0A4R0QNS7_9BIFI|nr:hypothetical protein [Alloscardovia theropitheci]TCD53862.1 hypothetical protein EJ419_06310 [Alloscardovia theropitheci]
MPHTTTKIPSFLHGDRACTYTLDDVVEAIQGATLVRHYTKKGLTYAKVIGPYHADALIPFLEIIMRIDAAGRIHVFHVNALQDGFMNRD